MKHFRLDLAGLAVGWRGLGTFGRLVELKDIHGFAQGEMKHEGGTGLRHDALVRLAQAHREQVEHAIEVVGKPSDQELEIARKRWVACLLEEELEGHPAEDEMEGCVRLAQFWSELNHPTYGPTPSHSSMTQLVSLREFRLPTEYRLAVRKHKAWLGAQIADLKEL